MSNDYPACRFETGKQSRAKRPQDTILAHFHQAIGLLPLRSHLQERTVNLGLRDLGIWAGEHRGGLSLGDFQQVTVSNDVGNLKTGQASLAGAEEFSRAAQFEIKFGDLEAVIRADHGIEPAFSFFGDLPPSHQDAKRLGCTAPDSPAQLMKLR